MDIPEAWWDSRAMRQQEAWRGVEAQHRVATMKLVDSAEAQATLEDLLEQSKPALPDTARAQHYLLATPFRYPAPVASRFRPAGALGIWYGAESVETACSELAWWGWRFLMDSTGLQSRQLVTEFTVFPARLTGQCLDISAAPWDQSRAQWQADDYAHCHGLALDARQRAVDWIRYWSARDVAGHCVAVLQAAALRDLDLTRSQTWIRKVSADSAFMLHEGQTISLRFGIA